MERYYTEKLTDKNILINLNSIGFPSLEKFIDKSVEYTTDECPTYAEVLDWMLDKNYIVSLKHPSIFDGPQEKWSCDVNVLKGKTLYLYPGYGIYEGVKKSLDEGIKSAIRLIKKDVNL